MYNKYKIAKFLLQEGAEVDQEDCFGETPLVRDIKKENLNMVDLLISYGANVDFLGQTSLIKASMYGSRKMVEMLVERGAYIDVLDKEGRSALYWASMFNRYNILDYLLKKGADVNKGYAGRYPLCIAFGRGNSDIVERILKMDNCNLEVEDAQMRTPLLISIVGNYFDFAIDLIQRGAYVNHIDRFGKSVKDYIEDKKVMLEKERKGYDLDFYDEIMKDRSNIREDIREKVNYLEYILREKNAVKDIGGF